MKQALILTWLLLVLAVPVGAQVRFTPPATATLPATCVVGDLVTKTGASAGLKLCTATNTWTDIATGLGGSGVGSASDTQVLIDIAGNVAGSANFTWNEPTDYDPAITTRGLNIATSLLVGCEYQTCIDDVILDGTKKYIFLGDYFYYRDGFAPIQLGQRITDTGTSEVIRFNAQFAPSANRTETTVGQKFATELKGAFSFPSVGGYAPTNALLTMIVEEGASAPGGIWNAYINTILDDASTPAIHDVHIEIPTLNNGATAGSSTAVWVAARSSIPNAYSFWHDARGVLRIKEDNPFDSVYQAIPALYNPQYRKYTPGAQAFERIVLAQFNGNVAEIGTETGPTQTLTSVTSVTTTATATKTAHGYSTGDVVTIAGADQAPYNGAYTVTRLTADTFSYTFAGSGTSPATGTITAQAGTLRNVRLIGAGLAFGSTLVAPSNSGTRYLCISTAGVVTSSSSACSGT